LSRPIHTNGQINASEPGKLDLRQEYKSPQASNDNIFARRSKLVLFHVLVAQKRTASNKMKQKSIEIDRRLLEYVKRATTRILRKNMAIEQCRSRNVGREVVKDVNERQDNAGW
jgi:hypothetical protein